MVVTAPGFAQARCVALDQGVPSVQVAVYPGPFDLHSDDELRQTARSVLVPRIIEAPTRTIPETDATVARTREIVFTGSMDAVNRYFTDCKWSDGLAIVPPTVGIIWSSSSTPITPLTSRSPCSPWRPEGPRRGTSRRTR